MNNELCFTLLKRYSGKLLYSYDGIDISYQRGELNLIQASRGKQRLKPIPMSLAQKAACRIRLLERLERLEPRFAIPCDNNQAFLVSWNGCLLKINFDSNEMKTIFRYRQGMRNPLSIAEIKGIPGFLDGYVFGDYWGNPSHDKALIYRVRNDMCETVFSFEPRSILHIHGCVPDPKHSRVLILTGDSDTESGIWQTKDDFSNVTPLLVGNQQYRTCAVFPVDDGIIYATDTPLENNGIYHYSESHRKITKLFDMPGPCIYSTTIEKDKNHIKYVFATSVEPDCNLPYWKYCFTYKLGAGVKDRMCYIVVGAPETGFEAKITLEKDIWPMLLFQFGNVQFPYQSGMDRLLVTPVAVKKYDGETLEFVIT